MAAESSALNQFLATILCNILMASYGASVSWAGPNFLILESDDTPLQSGKLSTVESSIVVSIPCLGAIISTIFYTFMLDRLGRKLLLLSLAVPQLLSWVTMLIATNVYHLYAARFFSGFIGGGLYIVVPIYVYEISEARVRGTLASMLILIYNSGILFGFVIANYLDYFGQIKINIILPIIFLAAFNYFPETPEYLLKRNQKIAAEKSRNFYRGIKNVRTLEMKKVDENDKTYEKIESESTTISFADFCNPAAKKATIIALFLGALNQLCGAFSMLNYTNKIFESAGSTIPSNTASIIVACVQLFANFITMILVDRAGRKILISISALGTAAGLIGMGMFDLFKDQLSEYTWIPVVAFSTIILMASIGMSPLTFVILAEILPKKIKNTVTFLSLEIIWILAFVLLSFYPTLTVVIGMYNCMFMFATCCIIGTVFYITVLPETKGKSYEEIIRVLQK